jgi:hypothetical protein
MQISILPSFTGLSCSVCVGNLKRQCSLQTVEFMWETKELQEPVNQMGISRWYSHMKDVRSCSMITVLDLIWKKAMRLMLGSAY